MCNVWQFTTSRKKKYFSFQSIFFVFVLSWQKGACAYDPTPFGSLPDRFRPCFVIRLADRHVVGGAKFASSKQREPPARKGRGGKRTRRPKTRGLTKAVPALTSFLLFLHTPFFVYFPKHFCFLFTFLDHRVAEGEQRLQMQQPVARGWSSDRSKLWERKTQTYIWGAFFFLLFCWVDNGTGHGAAECRNADKLPVLFAAGSPIAAARSEVPPLHAGTVGAKVFHRKNPIGGLWPERQSDSWEGKKKPRATAPAEWEL